MDKNARDEFQRLAERTELEVIKRLGNIVRALRGARGLYASVDQSVTRDQFRKYVLARDMDSDFPGVRSRLNQIWSPLSVLLKSAKCWVPYPAILSNA